MFMNKHLSIRHIGIPTNNMDNMLLFYCDVLGFDIEWDKQEDIKNTHNINNIVHTIKLSSHDSKLSVELIENMEYKNNNKNSFLFNKHISFNVKDIYNVYANITNHNSIYGNCNIISNGVVVNTVGSKIIVCNDPDSNYLELVEGK